MRHGSTMFRTLILLGLGICGFSGHTHRRRARGRPSGYGTVPILLLTRSGRSKSPQSRTRQVAECRRAAVALYDRAALAERTKDAGAQAARRAIDQEMSLWLDKYLTPEQLGRLGADRFAVGRCLRDAQPAVPR